MNNQMARVMLENRRGQDLLKHPTTGAHEREWSLM